MHLSETQEILRRYRKGLITQEKADELIIRSRIRKQSKNSITVKVIVSHITIT